ncbi:hypothetical protein G9A89_019458 [Geosiphon pyriformis]|nr:hypothetical protein G9A89_019458 [Geosiphon pyriformis]
MSNRSLPTSAAKNRVTIYDSLENAPMCRCRFETQLKCVTKRDSSNQGRLFWSCSQYNLNGDTKKLSCNYFKWAERKRPANNTNQIASASQDLKAPAAPSQNEAKKMNNVLLHNIIPDHNTYDVAEHTGLSQPAKSRKRAASSSLDEDEENGENMADEEQKVLNNRNAPKRQKMNPFPLPDKIIDFSSPSSLASITTTDPIPRLTSKEIIEIFADHLRRQDRHILTNQKGKESVYNETNKLRRALEEIRAEMADMTRELNLLFREKRVLEFELSEARAKIEKLRTS